MTGGVAVILGRVGDNFGAGMTGGMAYVYDPDNVFEQFVNPDSILWQRLDSAHWEHELKRLVSAHMSETQSALAARLLNAWDLELGKFWQICPKEMLPHLSHPLSDQEERARA